MTRYCRTDLRALNGLISFFDNHDTIAQSKDGGGIFGS